MIDHILKFDDETAAHTALDPLGWGGTNDGTPYWSGSVLGPRENFRGIVASAVWDNNDPMHPTLVTPEQVLPGFYLGIATAKQDESDALRALPGDVCRVILDRDASRPGAWSFLYVSPVVNPSDLASVRFEPIFAGSNY